MVEELRILIIEDNTKNGIAINHIMWTTNKSEQAAAARNSSCTHFYT